MHVRPGADTADELRRLLGEHLIDMHATSPAESVHALDESALVDPAVTFWTVWDDDPTALLGCVALKELGPDAGELKSMRTTPQARRRGVASFALAHVLEQARLRGYRSLSLETGTHPFFAPARTLYAAVGFTECGPFADYREDPHSVFMTLVLH